MQKTSPPQSHHPPDRCDNVQSGERPHSTGQGGERWCRCSRVGEAQAPAGTLAGPENAPCCQGWSMCQTGETPSLPTGSSCGGWVLG